MYWLEVWRMIRDMKEKGMSNREIARDLGISRNTVSKLVRTTRLTDHRKRKRVVKDLSKLQQIMYTIIKSKFYP